MEKQIWKWVLNDQKNFDNFTGIAKVSMPIECEILKIATQNNAVCAWGIVEPKKEENEFRYFQFVGTGHYLNKNVVGKYIDSVMINDMTLVFHIFEIEKPKK